ncbi:hypothetical protein YN1_6430 [Nanoarchaeota archaeon]
MVKNEIRIIGIDDGYFDRNKDKLSLIVGVIMRGHKQIDGVLSNKIEVDGFDVNDKIVEMIKRTKHYYQIKVIMTNGISFAGFNLLDFEYLYEKLNLPIISVVRKKPNLEKFIEAARHTINGEKRIEIIKRYPKTEYFETKYGKLYFQYYGIEKEEVIEIIKLTSIYSRIPEPVRVAHLIAMGVTKGYSKGKP